jgi:hypothetical protein
MKNFLPAFVIIFLFAELKLSSGQTYYPFPDTLTQWNEYGFACLGDPPQTICFYNGYLISLSHDTIIEGKNYVLVGINKTWEMSLSLAIPNATNFSFQFPGTIIGGLRTDLDKKVWFRKLSDGTDFSGEAFYYFPSDSDVLLYDFNIDAGDSLSWKFYNQKVVQIDSFQLNNGEWRKRFIFNYGEDWIEGIGSTFGLFGSYEPPPFEGGHFLTCFRQNDSLLFESLFNYSYDCDHVYTGILEPGIEISINVFPNPATDFLTFDLNNFTPSDYEISIYSSTGQLLNHFSFFYSTQLKIPVDEIGGDGMYFYTLKENGEKLLVGKFLIQR